MLPLAALALRRALPLWLVAGLALLLFLAARGSGSVPLVAGERAEVGLRALARQNVWSVLLVLAPLLFLQAARLGTDAATAWLAPTPAPRFGLALALIAGCAAASAAATLLTASVSEAATGDGPGWRAAGELEAPSAVLLDDTPVQRWRVPRIAHDQRLRLATTVAIGSGPAVTARFRARDGEHLSEVEARVAGRTELELGPPAGEGAELELELERVGPGALLVLPPHALLLLEPVASERRAALALGSRVFLLLAAGTALSLGLARWMRASLAAGVVLALAILSWTSAGAARFLPGADLPRAWSELASGLVPDPAPLAALAGAVALLVLGAALHANAPGGGERAA